MDILLFYLSEYWAYVTIMAVILIIAFFAFKGSHTYEDKRSIIIIVIICYLILFSGLGSCIKPYFTNTEKYTLKHKDILYQFRGTGTFINETQVMTNDHVIDGCKKLAIRTKDKIYAAKTIARLKRKDGDIAFLQSAANDRKTFALISNEKLKIGEILIYPNYTSKPGEFDKIKGKVTKLDSSTYGITMISPKGRPGNSGSPIYNQKGYLVGILHSGGLSLTKNEAYASPLQIVKNFAQKNKIKLFEINQQNRDLTKMQYFFQDYAVGILCAN